MKRLLLPLLTLAAASARAEEPCEEVVPISADVPAQSTAEAEHGWTPILLQTGVQLATVFNPAATYNWFISPR